MHFDSSIAADRDAHSPPDGPVSTGKNVVPVARVARDAHPLPDDLLTRVGLVGTSQPMQRLRTELLRYARSAAPVLIQGESGSGKELLARALHLGSARSRAPFVAVNVATLRGEVVASELFGHERGAFTGALTRHRGLFEQAHGGTLFLDEVGELDPRTQADLLRVLETGEVRPVGSERARTVNVRVVVATHRNVASMVAEGGFRADLYYRLNVLPVVAPPLRERRSDLPALVHHLLARLQPEMGPRTVSPDALVLLRRHDWPGNVRELLNVLRRAAAQSEEQVLDAAVLRGAIGHSIVLPPGRPRPVAQSTRGNEDVTAALTATGGNISAAARRLGIARSTLRERLDASRRGDACPIRSPLQHITPALGLPAEAP